MFRKSDVRSHHTAELLGKIQLHLYRRFVLYINVFRLSLLPGRPAQGGDGKTFPWVCTETKLLEKLICDLTTQLNCWVKFNYIYT